MKKKIISLCLVVCLVAIAAMGTLAYFTDTDEAENVFTLGNVEIALEEVYGKNVIVMPNEETKTTKEVDVKNTGISPAYVRVHIAVPADMVDTDLNSYNNALHINFSKASVAAGLWSWLPEYSEELGWTGNGAENFNHYFQEIDGKNHLVFVVTYRTALASGETTADNAMYAFYLDKYLDAVENEDGSITYSKPTFTDSSRTNKNGNMSFTVTKDEAGKFTSAIKVIAEGTQVDSFDNAYDALNTAFGKPGTYNPWVATPAN